MGRFRLIDRLQHLFKDSVTIEPWSGQNGYGEATYGAGTVYRARIERGVAHTNGQDQSLYGLHKIILSTYVQVDPRDRITLPSSYGERNDAGIFAAPATTIREVNYLSDEYGPLSTVLYLSLSGGQR